MTTSAQQNLEFVWKAFNALTNNKDKAIVEQSFSKNTIQHNSWGKDGIDNYLGMLAMDMGYTRVRSIAEGDIVAFQGYYPAPNPMGDKPVMSSEIWRVKNDSGNIKKIVEHWDVLCYSPTTQEQVDMAYAGGGNGEDTEVSETRITQNKATVVRFLDYVFNRGRAEIITSLLSSSYIYYEEHGKHEGPHTLEEYVKSCGGKVLHDCKRIIASGDLVMAHLHLLGDVDRATCNWFRLDEESKITEHWSTIQDFTPLEQVGNEHPHF